MLFSLMTMLLAAEAQAETAQQQTVQTTQQPEDARTEQEKAEDDAMKHLDDAMKKLSGENENEDDGKGKGDDNSVHQPPTVPEPKPEGDRKPDEGNPPDKDATTNSAPEQQDRKPKDGNAKPPEDAPDEEPFKGLEASLDKFINTKDDFGDDEMMEFMKGVKILVEQVKGVMSAQKEMKSFIDDQNAQKLEAAIDEGFDALSDDLADVFGRGTGRKIEKAFLENREKALQKVAILKAGYEASKQDYTLQGLIREAAMILAPELMKSVPQSRRREFITPPSKPDATQLTGDEAAFAEFSKKLKDIKKE